MSDLDPRIVKLVASVSEERLGAILKKLESFETRSSLSSTTSTTRGVGAARQWILDEMKGYSPKLQVSFDTYQVRRKAASPATVGDAQRHGAAPGPEPAADLRQRPLRHGGAAGRTGRQQRRRAPRDPDAPPRRPPTPTRRSTTSHPA